MVLARVLDDRVDYWPVDIPQASYHSVSRAQFVALDFAGRGFWQFLTKLDPPGPFVVGQRVPRELNEFCGERL